MTQEVLAQVILRAADGKSILDAEEPLTAEATARYRVEPETMRQARERLSGYGFTLGPAGPHGLPISGDRELFERVFRTRLKAREAARGEPQPELGGTEFFEPQAPITIPDDLSDLVAAVTLVAPPELFP